MKSRRMSWAEHVALMEDEQRKQNFGRNKWKKRKELAYMGRQI
jgi:hypothetical protein